MATVQQQSRKSISKYFAAIILAILPVALALSEPQTTLSGVIPAMTSGAYPLAFTALSWGLVVKLVLDSRK